MIRTVTGLNEARDASTPDPRFFSWSAEACSVKL